jgi:5-methylcytosine-specific restriction enzyme A
VASFLLTWNPSKWHWPEREFAQTLDRIAAEGRAPDRWSCGSTKRIGIGDRVFLLRQGDEPRGIIGSGWVTEPPFSDDHWSDTGSLPRSALYIDLEWDWLAETPLLPRSRLNEPLFAGVNWNTQSSGISIEAEAARELEREWSRLVGSNYAPPAEEIPGDDYWEGAAYQIAVNAFERSASARQRCIKHYGSRCAVCGFLFSAHYGESGRDVIQVHHLVPIASIRRGYRINAITDLLPVCANCHVIIHRREPPYTPEEVRSMIERASEERPVD